MSAIENPIPDGRSCLAVRVVGATTGRGRDDLSIPDSFRQGL